MSGGGGNRSLLALLVLAAAFAGVLLSSAVHAQPLARVALQGGVRPVQTVRLPLSPNGSPRGSMMPPAQDVSTAGSAATDAGGGRRVPDAVLHAGSSASIQLMAYGGLRVVGASRRDAMITSVAVALLAGVGKELYDARSGGDASVRDLFWDVVGTGAGAAMSHLVDR